MTAQNRVTPFGHIIADPARGALTGNRGVLHDPVKRALLPKRRWASKTWIYCLCDFKGRTRDVMGANGPNGSPGWTNLFFLDEATALAAGHRPCFTCQRDRATAFTTCWEQAMQRPWPGAQAVDSILHGERLSGRSKKLHSLERFQNGIFVSDNGQRAYLVAAGSLWPWSPSAYGAPIPLRLADLADWKMVTSPTIARVIAAGFSPATALLPA